ncbi:hypothetical protein MLD38_035333 [Melastoma candidum]|uniref:Uncharacterized protein n=1 Tax=Melastoma candidum TaxID=119954 RepID=A0ACB9LGZ8_9MYRT|nr:hypothetical protein MLD38_035333 [Melastoma candidum]
MMMKALRALSQVPGVERMTVDRLKGTLTVAGNIDRCDVIRQDAADRLPGFLPRPYKHSPQPGRFHGFRGSRGPRHLPATSPTASQISSPTPPHLTPPSSRSPGSANSSMSTSAANPSSRPSLPPATTSPSPLSTSSTTASSPSTSAMQSSAVGLPKPWGVGKNWSAAKQVQAMSANLVAPCGAESAGITVPAHVMSTVVVFVMWTLVAAIPCQERSGLATTLQLPKLVVWAQGMTGLVEKIGEEWKRKEKKGGAGLI